MKRPSHTLGTCPDHGPYDGLYCVACLDAAIDEEELPPAQEREGQAYARVWDRRAHAARTATQNDGGRDGIL